MINLNAPPPFPPSLPPSFPQAFWPSLQVLAGELPAAKMSYRAFYALWKQYQALPEVYDLRHRVLLNVSCPSLPPSLPELRSKATDAAERKPPFHPSPSFSSVPAKSERSPSAVRIGQRYMLLPMPDPPSLPPSPPRTRRRKRAQRSGNDAQPFSRLDTS